MPRTINVSDFEIKVNRAVYIDTIDGDGLIFTRDEWREVRDAVDRLLLEKSVDANPSQD